MAESAGVGVTPDPAPIDVRLQREQGMGEGSHFYKIKGRYYIVSAIPGAHTPMKCARADKLAGPWEVKTISEKESLGIGQGYSLKDGPVDPRAEPHHGSSTGWDTEVRRGHRNRRGDRRDAQNRIDMGAVRRTARRRR